VTIATQATLAALLAKTLAAPATEAKQDTGNTSLATIATQTAGLATAAGLTSTGTKLDTLHTDLTGSLTTQNRSVTASGTITAVNGAVGDGSTDRSTYASARIQLAGTFTATVVFESSIDGTNWINRQPMDVSSIKPVVSGTSTAGIYVLDLGSPFFRVRASAFTSGTIAVTVQYSAAPIPTNAVSLLGQTNIIGGVNIGTGGTLNAFTSVSAATTNATSVKASAGLIQEVTIANVTATAVYWKLYNKASAPTVGTDVPVLTIPVPASSSTAYTFGANGKRMTTGIAWALTAAIAATDTSAVTAGVQVSGSYV
jgi:hypothetical protein